MIGERRLVVGISGASGAAIGLRVLELLRQSASAEIHLVVTPAARRTLAIEVDEQALDRARGLAHVVHRCSDLAAPIASGSFRCDGMIVAPCSLRTLSAVACGLADNLLTRAADVALKERRRLVLLARESPLHAGHIEAMLKVTRLGAIVMPPVPAFYTRPETVDQIVTQIAGRAIELAGVEIDGVVARWNGAGRPRDAAKIGDGSGERT
ncbi:MAG: UbiX family flavin prenyltransferase [Pseudomonadota bacterium]